MVRARYFSRIRWSFMVWCGQMQLALAAPNADYPHVPGITPVHNAKRRMDEFPQKGLIEFRHYPSHIRMIGKGLDALARL